MAQYSVWIIAESDLSITNAEVLDGGSHGNGSNLLNEFITINSPNWQEVLIDDNETYFADSDSSQTLDGAQTIDGFAFADGALVEAEYTLTLSDGVNTYTAIGFNANQPSGASYATTEGLAFIGGPGGFPPVGVPLEVIATSEGPGGTATPYASYASPICITGDCFVETRIGSINALDLKVGDEVLTASDGYQPIRWIGKRYVSVVEMLVNPAFRPVQIRKSAFGRNKPSSDMTVSQQHRILVDNYLSELYFSGPSLAAAKHLIDGKNIVLGENQSLTYVHFMCDAHQIVRVNGVKTESFLPGEAMLGTVSSAALRELFLIFPELKENPQIFPAAHRLLTRAETKLLCGE